MSFIIVSVLRGVEYNLTFSVHFFLIVTTKTEFVMITGMRFNCTFFLKNTEENYDAINFVCFAGGVSLLFFCLWSCEKQIKSSSSLLLSAFLVSDADWRLIFKGAIFHYKNEFNFQNYEKTGVGTYLLRPSSFALPSLLFLSYAILKSARCVYLLQQVCLHRGVMVCWIVHPLSSMTTPKSSSSVLPFVIHWQSCNNSGI